MPKERRISPLLDPAALARDIDRLSLELDGATLALGTARALGSHSAIVRARRRVRLLRQSLEFARNAKLQAEALARPRA